MEYDPVNPAPAGNAPKTARSRGHHVPRACKKPEGISMLIRIPHVLLFAFMLLALSAHTQAEQSPKLVVQTAVDTILGILADDTLNRDQKREKMRETINERFDFRAMSQSTLATNWKKATKDEQKQFVDLFAKLIQNSYIGKVEAYTNETVEYPAEKIKGKRAVVNTLIITSSAEIPVNYKLYLKNAEWHVYDVIIEGVSLISSYRSTYQEIVMKDGFQGLFAKMEEKLKELENQPS
jgi:phospholipid transport system substrate-binding protein